MSKARFAVIGTLIVSLVACSGGGPSQGDRQSAFLLYVQDNSNDKAKIEDFESGKCVKAEGAPSYTCDVSAKVEALGRISAVRWMASTRSLRSAGNGRSPAASSKRSFLYPSSHKELK